MEIISSRPDGNSRAGKYAECSMWGIDMAENNIRDLGMLNGMETTDEIENCEAARHKTKYEVVGTCLTRYTCPICGITWTVDSSD